jgi:hypothetical protein
MAYNNLYKGLRRGQRGRTYQPVIPQYLDPNYDVKPPEEDTQAFDLNPNVVDHRMRLLNQKKQAQEILPLIPEQNRADRAYYQNQIAAADQFLNRSYGEGENNKIVDRYQKLKGDILDRYKGLTGPENDPLAQFKTTTIPGSPEGYGVLPGETVLEYRNRMKRGEVPGPLGNGNSRITQNPYDTREIVIPPVPNNAYPPINPAPISGGIKGGGGPLTPLPPKPGIPKEPPIGVPVPPRTPGKPRAPIRPEPVPGNVGKPIEGPGSGLDARPPGPGYEPPRPGFKPQPIPPEGPMGRPGPLDPRPPGPGYEPPAPGFRPIPIPKGKPPAQLPPRPGPLDPRPPYYPPEPQPVGRVPEPIPPMPAPKPPRPIPPRPPIAPTEPAPDFPRPTPGIKGQPGPRGPKGPAGPMGPGGEPGGGIGGGPRPGHEPVPEPGPILSPGGIGMGPAGVGIGSQPSGPGSLDDINAKIKAAQDNGDFNTAADLATIRDNYIKGQGIPGTDPRDFPKKPAEPIMSVGQPAPMPVDNRPAPPPIGTGGPAPAPAAAIPPKPAPRPQYRFTPRSILSERPPRPDLHDPSMMGIDKSQYQYGNLPDVYNIDQAPTQTPRQQLEDIGRYKEPLPNQEPAGQAPDQWNPQGLQKFDRYGQPLPEGYGYSEAPDFTTPDKVDTAQRYGIPTPDVYAQKELPPIERGPQVQAPTQYGEARPDIYGLENAPEVTPRNTDMEKYATPESVGRMGAVERFDKFSALNKAEIERPPELGQPTPQGGVDFTKLMDWKNKTGDEKFVPAQFQNDPLAAWRAGLGDLGNTLLGGKYEGRAEQALQNQVGREKEFWATEEKRKDATVNRNIAMKDMGLKEQTLKGNIANMAANQNIALRKQDMDYLVEGARLGTDVYKTRVGERLGLGRLALEGDRLQMDALKQYTDSSQEAQKADIGAKNTDISNQREKTKLANETIKDVASIQEQQDRMLFDRWAKKQGLTGERYRDELSRHKQGYEEHKDFTQFKMEQERLNAAQEADFQKTRLSGYQMETGAMSDRYKNLLAKYQAGYATEKDYQDMVGEQAKFNSQQKTKFEENQLKRWESNLAGKSQTFKDSLDKWKAGYATEKDYRELTNEQNKFDITVQGKVADQEIEKWKAGEGFKDNRYGKELDKWKAGQKNEFDYLQEKRLTHGLNAEEQNKFDRMDLDKWKMKEDFKSEQYKNNLTKWRLGQTDLQFATEEERRRFEANNDALNKADSNALTKYGRDTDLWKDYNKLPSEIRKNEAEADAYMQKALAEKQGKKSNPLELAKYVDDLNQKWSQSEEYKGYQQAGTYLGKIINAPPSGFGDTSALYGFIKSIDPTSSVREGERDFALNSMGWLADNSDKVPVGIARLFEKVKSGKMMTPEDRFALADAAYKATDVNKWRYEDRLKQHESAMTQFGMGDYKQQLLKLADFSFGKDKNGYPQWTHKMNQKALEGNPPYYPKTNPKSEGTNPNMPLPDERPGSGIGPKRDQLNG